MGRGRRRGLAPLRKAWGVNVSLLRGQRSANGRRVAEHPGKRAGAEADGENRERRAGDDLRNLVAGASQKPRTGRGKSGFPSTPPPLAPATSFPAPRLFLLAGRSGKPPNLSRVSPQDSLRRSPSATSRALSRFFILPRLRRLRLDLVPRSATCFFHPCAVPPTSHALVASLRLGPRLSCLPFPLAPRFPRRPPLCPMVLAALSLSATGFASHAFFPSRVSLTVASRAPVAPSIPAASPPSLPAAFPSSFVFRAEPRAPFAENRPQSPCAQAEAMRVQGI